MKSLIVLALVAMMAIPSTLAWFSSTVTAANNEISTGTMSMAIDSTRTNTYANGAWNLYDAYTVAYDNNGVLVNNHQLQPWTNAEPGPYVPYAGGNGTEPNVPGNKSVWFSVRNRGTLSAKAQVVLDGRWVSGSRLPATPNNNLVRVQNIYVYGGGNSACERHEECRNIRDGLNGRPGLGLSNVSTAKLPSALSSGPWNRELPGFTFYLTSNFSNDPTKAIVLDPNEYVIVRLDLNLSTSAGNEYQGATYHYDVTVNGSQTVSGAPW